MQTSIKTDLFISQRDISSIPYNKILVHLFCIRSEFNVLFRGLPFSH